MRSDRDEAARFRLEVQALQRENAELRKSQRIIQGVPEKDHAAALEHIDSLESRLSTAAQEIQRLRQKPKDTKQSDQWRAHVHKLAGAVSDARAVMSENAKLKQQNQQLSASFQAMNQRRKSETEQLKARICELECRLRRTNDDQN